MLLGLGSLAWFSSAETVGIAKLAALLCVFGISAFCCRGSFRVWRPFVLGPALIVGGMLLAALETARLDTVVPDSPVTTNLRGTVLSREPDDKGRWRYVVEVKETSRPQLRRPPAKVTLLARSRHEPFAVGSVIEGRARLSPPSGPALPGLNDFAFDAYFRGVGAVGFFYGAPRGPADIAAYPGERSLLSRASAYLGAVRETVGNRIRVAIGGDTGAIAAALVTAEERAISRETVETLRAAGLSHVLAISGLNMVLAAGTFLVGARTLLSLVPSLAERLPVKKIAAAGALLMVFVYILISGGAVFALRSWIMISIMLVAVFFDRVSISLRNVALAALIIIAWTPSAVAGPGFQMSFAATLALVAGYARWRDHRARDREKAARGPAWGAVSGLAVGTAATSLIGGLATAVYAAAHFHRLPAYGLVANVLATPLISILIMPFGLFAMLLMPFGLEHYPLIVMGKGLDWMLAVAGYVASFDGEWITGRVGDAGFFLVAFGGVILCVLRTRLALAGAALVLLGGSAIALERQAPRPSITISEDGLLVGLVGDDAIATNRNRPPDFVFSQWQRALAVTDHVPPMDASPDDVTASKAVAGRKPRMAAKSELLDAATSAAEAKASLATARPGAFVCRKDEWCVARSREGWTIAVFDKPEIFPALCESADLVIAATRRPLPACSSGKALVVTGQTLRKSGAIEIYADQTRTDSLPHLRVVKAFTSTERPWQRHRRYDWRSGSFSSEEPVL
ncbi:ComEC family competence protein [Sinorhizobium numidicum]|uniref:ComEC family competence protein n=1 Tax=Sinorhizobium numidicum TaxID=680248 RepID=A0ABY8D2Q1_9HYPH|nr:ComEC/Rec2 family competence protein [Sinorhizobium numidicum]WEX79154.1 ComEC family competence protein [Sinorhizobium numidicum]WEX85179.1 ComEC family competence protein [Sinorhizobium numidicum]